MKAPMSRVFPTPVASAKQTEGKSRSKSVTDSYSLRISSKASATAVDLLGGTISVIRWRRSSDSRWGGRRLRRPEMALTWRFIISKEGGCANRRESPSERTEFVETPQNGSRAVRSSDWWVKCDSEGGGRESEQRRFGRSAHPAHATPGIFEHSAVTPDFRVSSSRAADDAHSGCGRCLSSIARTQAPGPGFLLSMRSPV